MRWYFIEGNDEVGEEAVGIVSPEGGVRKM
jgi:hypothetical protein